ncbi:MULTISPECIES: TetR/AcrR family transcriptional regulator [Lysinibacillus]|uniref:TetR/AcrR family transcriptional regulator n=1 Tax=Lysinibacillus TaxID=400634 RepID=UPI001C8B78DE|nr:MULTISPECIES: TetR/AcrR family transcriptional regulator [Lysinibacillus]MBX8943254.1 TetR/AcrR family transcriptional regulator [Lysinibacillus sp. K60]UUV23066.1 TetR/AcrR family transcriptional regulator [Lysinibacillus sp. FN11]UYB45931.1 TetR/AcrR family transcriptional regulator [Lysinibacillus capsici]
MLRAERKKELKEHIFLQAIQLFKEKGYEAVTVQEIVSVCGIAKGTFFNYFSRKDDILLYLGTSQLEKLTKQLNHYQYIENPKALILVLLGDLLKRLTEHGELMKLVVMEIMKSSYLVENEYNSIQKLQKSIESIVEQAKINGTLQSEHETTIIASSIISTYFHTLLSWSLQQSEEKDIEALFEQHLDIVWKGISK